MTQTSYAQQPSKKVASTQRARQRTVAQRRADLEQQLRLVVSDSMALTEPDQVRRRMKTLRKRAGDPTQYEVALALNEPHRTFQSWENAEVETDRANYEKVARYYSKKLGEKVTANWILFGEDKPSLPTPDLSRAATGNGDGPDLASVAEQLAEILTRLERLEGAVYANGEAIQELARRLSMKNAPKTPPSSRPAAPAARVAARGSR